MITDGKATLKIAFNAAARTAKKASEFPAYLHPRVVRSVEKFHAKLDGYEPTPLVSLSNLSRAWGVGHILVKDESRRFGLNAFKGLGGTYAMGCIMSRKIGVDIEDLGLEQIKSEFDAPRSEPTTFITVTAGNHGRGVAWAARQLGQRAVIYLPKGSPTERLEAIRRLGAEAVDTGLNYTDSMELAKAQARTNGWELLQDIAWEGYTQIPTWVMQGYLTMMLEAQKQMETLGIEKPTHLILQVGAGSFAAAVVGYYANRFADARPITVIIEPDCCANLFLSAVTEGKTPREITGDFANKTMITSLACGIAPDMAWEVLGGFADVFVACPDCVAARGMRIYANPLGDDRRLVAGEASGTGMGLLSLLLRDPGCAQAREKLGLDDSACVLLINSEGDTNPKKYRKVLWDGSYPMPQ